MRLGPAGQHAGDADGAGAGAAGQRDARAALPGPHPDLARAETTSTKWTLTRRGKAGWCSSAGPSVSSGNAAHVVHVDHRVRVAHRDAVTASSRSSTSQRRVDRRVGPASSVGISAASRIGSPMSTRTPRTLLAGDLQVEREDAAAGLDRQLVLARAMPWS